MSVPSWRSLISIEQRETRGQALHPWHANHRVRCVVLPCGGHEYRRVLTDFPYLTSEDIRACLAFAAERERPMLVALT